MTCSRCRGLMVPHRIEGGGEIPHTGTVPGWRCLLCGETIDVVIMANRRGHSVRTKDQPRPPYPVWSSRSRRKAMSP